MIPVHISKKDQTTPVSKPFSKALQEKNWLKENFQHNCFPICFSFNLKSHTLKSRPLTWRFPLNLFPYCIVSPTVEKLKFQCKIPWILVAILTSKHTRDYHLDAFQSTKESCTKANPTQVLFWAKISPAMKSCLMVLQCVIKIMPLLWLSCHKTKLISLGSLKGTHMKYNSIPSL